MTQAVGKRVHVGLGERKEKLTGGLRPSVREKEKEEWDQSGPELGQKKEGRGREKECLAAR